MSAASELVAVDHRRQPPAQRDVVFAFFGVSWAAAAARGFIMPEDRLAAALLRHPAVRGLLVANPYRSVAGRALARARRRDEPALPAREAAALYEPLRLRRRDPADPRAAVARYERGLRRAAERLGLERPAIVTAHPLLAGFGRFDWAGPVTYYGWDDWTASVPHLRWWRAYEQAFAGLRATERRVVAISDAALERIAPTGPGAVIENGLEPSEWESFAQPPRWFATRPHPRLLYVGSLDSRVDVEQVAAVARAYPDGSVTLVGPMLDHEHFAPLRALENVAVAPPVGRREIASAIAAADACLIPHADNRLTRAMSPLKLYEYLAAGRPVAAVDLPPIAKVRGRVALAPAGGDLVPAVARALAMGAAPEAERRAFVAEHAWAGRFERLLEVALAA